MHLQRLDLAEEDAELESASVPANMVGRQTIMVIVDRRRHLLTQQTAWAQPFTDHGTTGIPAIIS